MKKVLQIAIGLQSIEVHVLCQQLDEVVHVPCTSLVVHRTVHVDSQYLSSMAEFFNAIE